MEAAAILLLVAFIACLIYNSNLLEKQASLKRGNLLLQVRIEKLNLKVSELTTKNAHLTAQVKYLYNAQETIVVEEPAVKKIQLINVEVLSITPNNSKEIK